MLLAADLKEYAIEHTEVYYKSYPNRLLKVAVSNSQALARFTHG